MSKRSLVCFFIFYYLLRESNSLYIGESHQRMKWKLIHLDKELVMEATRNVERIQHFRKKYQKSKLWPIGHMLFTLRSRFGRMIRLYTLSLDNLDTYEHNQHIRHLSEIQSISMEIYTLVELIEEWDQRDRIKRAEEKEEYLQQYKQIDGPHPSPRKGVLRSARKLPKIQTFKKPSKVSTRADKNSNPLQFYDGGFASDIN